MRNPVNHVIGQPLHLEARPPAWSTYGRGQQSTASAVRLRLRLLVWGFLFRSVVLAGVTGLQGSRIALRRREDIQVEQLPENALGGLVVYDRLRVAVAVGIVVHFLLTRVSGALLLAALLATGGTPSSFCPPPVRCPRRGGGLPRRILRLLLAILLLVLNFAHWFLL